MAERHLDPDSSVAASAELLEMDSAMVSCDGVLRSYRQSTRKDLKKWGTSGSGIQTRTLRAQPSPENAARERSRVRNLRQAFRSLQAALPSVPPDTKLSKLDVLVLATSYIAHLTHTLDQGGTVGECTVACKAAGYLHPVKKWPMRSLLYCGNVEEMLSGISTDQMTLSEEEGPHPLTPGLGHQD